MYIVLTLSLVAAPFYFTAMSILEIILIALIVAIIVYSVRIAVKCNRYDHDNHDD